MNEHAPEQWSARQVEAALRDLARRGECVKRHASREVWRLETAGRPLIVKFYPHARNRLRKLLRGNLAMHEFKRLQWLQQAKVAAPRAVAVLLGFSLGNVKGDALVMEAVEPAEQLDLAINRAALAGKRLPQRRSVAQQVIEIVAALQRGRIRDPDLHLGNFMLTPTGRVVLIDAYPLRRGRPSRGDLYKLALSVRGIATRAEIIRAWRRLAPGEPLPLFNPLLDKHWRKLQSRVFGNNSYFSRLRIGGWRGICFTRAKFPRHWSPASALTPSPEDWQREWPALLQRLTTRNCEVLKDAASGRVSACRLRLGGRELEVITKEPRRKNFTRLLSQLFNGSRARRAWKRSWAMLHRDVPTAWPLLMMERYRLGFAVEQLIVYERIDGDTLATMPLSRLPADQRRDLFFRLGAVLRRLEESGLYNRDTKSTNWIIRHDPTLGPLPIIVDVDGVDSRGRQGGGMLRLLRAMREHPEYTPEDSLHLCRGYTPFSPVPQEEPPAPDDTAAR